MTTVAKMEPSRLQFAETMITDWAYAAKEGTTIEDLLRPEFWAHRARDLKPMSFVRVLADDGSYFAELIVLASGIGFAKMMLLRKVEIDGETGIDEALPELIVEYKGPVQKHRVVRKKDGVVLRDGFSAKVDAEAFARDYARTVAA